VSDGPFDGQLARVDARLERLARLTPEDEREGFESVTFPARETARNLARVILALGATPHIYPGTDRGGCHVEVDAVTVYIAGDGRVVCVVTLEPGDDET